MHLVIYSVRIVEIRVLVHSEIDMRKWESCVGNSLNTCIFAHCWYLDTLTLSWQAVVMDDYYAVMPFFVDGDKACLMHGVAWTGIYSQKGVDADICGRFIDALDRKYKKIDLVFDKYFILPLADTQGIFLHETVYQLDTVNPPEKFSDGDGFLEVLKRLYPKYYDDSIRFREYNSKNVGALSCDNFMKMDRKLNIRHALKLRALVERSVVKRFGYYMEISLSDNKPHGAILVTFCDGYIFVPYIRCDGIQKSFAQYTMILDFVMRHFAYRPGILVIDQARLGIRGDVIRNLGAKAFSTYRYRAGFMIKLRKLLRF